MDAKPNPVGALADLTPGALKNLLGRSKAAMALGMSYAGMEMSEGFTNNQRMLAVLAGPALYIVMQGLADIWNGNK